MFNSRRVVRRLGALTALAGFGLLLAVAPASAATLAAAAATDFDIATYVEGLSQPTDVAILPDGRAVIIQRAGDIAIQTPEMPDYVEAHIDVESGPAEQGLLGVVADPGFATNGLIYFYASTGPDQANRHQILRYKLDDAGVLSERTVVVSMGLRGPANHNGGAIDIYGGNLYIGVGDTGANATPPQNHFGSCLNVANGKVLRVSLTDGAMLGQPPADNPLVDLAMVTGCTQTGGDNGAFGMFAPEKRIYAWGFRNPFRLWVDQTTGKVWVGDVGETTREEIAIVEKGQHHGYPFHEGTTEYNQNFKPANGCMGLTPATACTEPVFDYARGNGGATIGGRILDGCAWKPEWKSRYIFGDHEQGKIWTLDVNQARDGVVANSLKDFATSNRVVAFRMGTDNALYIVEDSGRVSRVTAKGSTTTPNSCPSVNGDGSANPPVGGSGAGGNAAGGSAPVGGGAPATGGTNNGTGGTNNNGNAGNPGNPGAGTGPAGPGNPNGGSNSTSGGTNGSSAGAAGSADGGGCGCRAVGSPAGSALSLVALAGALGLAFQRRRRAPRS